ncbi:MAG: ABC transporter ATP-binding protein [Candidatus Hodarchaeales archaeon]|jgi:ABC-2 type transport system ATP-binding protein
MDIITFDKVSKIYGDVVAVSEINGSVEEGVVGFLGPNGAGKTTIIRMLTGDLRPSGGRLFVFGKNPWNNVGLRRRIGYIPERAKLFEWMTPIKFVQKLGQTGGEAREEACKAAMDALDIMGARKYRKKRISTLSKGMRQRVKIAAAISRPRDLLIADEPLAGLDPLGRELIFELFARLWKEQQTSIFVSSHILFEIQRFTQRMIMLFEGKIIAQGKTKQIRQLLTDYPFTYEVICTRSRSFVYDLLNLGVIQSVEFPQGIPADEKQSTLLRLTTTQPEEFNDAILQLTEQPNYRVTRFLNVDEQIATEKVFSYLIKRKEGI